MAESLRIGLGTVQFGLKYGVANRGGKISYGEAGSILQTARIRKINTLDTAIAYGDSETVLGDCGIDDFKIVTKLPGYIEGRKSVEEWVRQNVSDSLARLKVGRIETVLLHKPSDLLEPFGNELYSALVLLKEEGTVERIGVSIYDPTELGLLTKNFGIDVVQAPFNIFDQRLMESGWLDRLQSQGVAIHTRSAFLQGLLLMSQNELPEKFGRWSRLFEVWYDYLAEYQISALEACISHSLSIEGIEKVIVGVDSAVQLDEIVAACKKPFSAPTAKLSCADLDLLIPSRWSFL